VKTNIARNARLDARSLEAAGDRDPGEEFQRIAKTTPEKAAQQILAAVQHDRSRVLVGTDAKVIDLVSRLPAGMYQRPVIAAGRLGQRMVERRQRRR
jgi:hypothetical protein